MGLNLLGVISLNLPSIDFDVRTLNLSPILTSYMAGATFALVASPCSTPVLATLLVRTRQWWNIKHTARARLV